MPTCSERLSTGPSASSLSLAATRDQMGRRQISAKEPTRQSLTGRDRHGSHSHPRTLFARIGRPGRVQEASRNRNLPSASQQKRLIRTRFTTHSGEKTWLAGADPDDLRELASYWSDVFDWRSREARLNSFPHFVTRLDGRQLHFLHVRGADPVDTRAELPLILNHGWPTTAIILPPQEAPDARPISCQARPSSAILLRTRVR